MAFSAIVSSIGICFSQGTYEFGDVVFNEILYRPTSMGEEFIELRNNLDHFIQTEDYYLIVADDTISLGLIKMNPQSYIVLSRNKSILEDQYSMINTEQIQELKIPRLTDSGKKLILLAKTENQETVLDSFFYNSSYHNSLIVDDKGVSLEKIDPYFVPNQNNWTSCRDEIYFATPTRENSVSGEFKPGQKLEFNYSEVISPNGDGNQDVFFIKATSPEFDYFVSASVVDVRGFPYINVTNKIEIVLLESQDWAQVSDLVSGHYFLLLEVFNDSGFRELFQLPFAVIR